EVPLPEGDRQYIAWLRAPDHRTPAFFSLPAESLLGPNAIPASLMRDFLKDRYVLIGGIFEDRDRHRTPLSLWSETLPGVVIHAHILRQMLDRAPIISLDSPKFLAIFLPLAAIAGYWISRRRIGRGHPRLFEAATVAFWLAISIVAFGTMGIAL